MVSDELSAIIKALNNLEQSASFAQKYGPYFFAVALLIITPFVARAVFNKSIQGADEDLKEKAYADFRFYFRSTLMVGILCVFAGVGWWLYDSYREGARTLATVTELKDELQKFQGTMKEMNFATYGVIGPGLKAHDVFYQTQFNDELSIVFAKLPSPLPQSEASWLFVVLSNKELTSPLNFSVGWSPSVATGDTPGALTLMPIHLTVAKRYDVYKFSIGSDGASIQPVSAAAASPASTGPAH